MGMRLSGYTVNPDFQPTSADISPHPHLNPHPHLTSSSSTASPISLGFSKSPAQYKQYPHNCYISIEPTSSPTISLNNNYPIPTDGFKSINSPSIPMNLPALIQQPQTVEPLPDLTSNDLPCGGGPSDLSTSQSSQDNEK
jgi:hypothetical protein